MARLMSLVMLTWLMMGGMFLPRIQAARSPQSGDPAVGAPSSTRAVLDRYCVPCHNERARVGGLVLEHIDVRDIGGGAAIWEKVIRKVRTGAMPPAGRHRPDPSTVRSLVAGLETALDRVAAVYPDPGRTAVHRLNRAEYANAVRDLLHLEVDSRALLPPDVADKHGFDNIADALSVAPLLLERYMSAARQISRLAVGASPGGAVVQTYTISEHVNQDYRLGDNFPFGSRGGIAVQHYFPVDGEYVIQVRLSRNNYGYILGLGRPHRLEVHLDRARVGQLTVGGAVPGEAPPLSFAGAIQGDPEWENYALEADAGLEVRFPARAGQRLVTVSFVNDALEPEGVLQPREGQFGITHNEKPYKNPGVERILIEGPIVEAGPGETPSRRRIFRCRPRDAGDEEPCAQRILADLARRAYRRPTTEEDVRTLVDFYRKGRRQKDFEAGVQLALERLLVDPDFLFRIEWDPETAASGTVYRISDLDLASRLSFFLWSSIPDEELLDIAVAGQLRNPAMLERQVRRMIADPKAKALVSNFAGQWLELRNIREVAPDPEIFPDFDGNLREAFKEETELFVESQIREDRGLIELLTATHTFVNDRLARHYGIPHVYGNRFRRVTLEAGSRGGGLLGHGSLLTVTSLPNRTSPVLRGKWILDNVLGTPPPPPPPNVPELDEEGADERPRSMRERLEQHRRNPVCASCHAQMDPLGFAMENFDAIGAWRATEAGSPIDASGVMPGGSTFDGPAGLRELLVADGEQFVMTVTEKLLAYALGRNLEYYDQPAVRTIVRDSAASDYRWSSILLGIVNSTPFQMRKSAS